MNFFIDRFAPAIRGAVTQLDWQVVDEMVQKLAQVRATGGRLFVLGLGGSAGNASHLVNDFRKLAGMECYAPTDNVSELTARINDDGWGNALVGWLKVSNLSARDGIFVLSVGGGDADLGVSLELVHAVRFAKEVGSTVFGIVGRDGGYTARAGDNVVIVPTIDDSLITPTSEALQAVIWHGIVTHPDLARSAAHWESLSDS